MEWEAERFAKTKCPMGKLRKSFFFRVSLGFPRDFQEFSFFVVEKCVVLFDNSTILAILLLSRRKRQPAKCAL